MGWLNTNVFDETGDEEKAQGWTALIVDANGNGKRDGYVEPNQPVDPSKELEIRPTEKIGYFALLRVLFRHYR